MEENLAVVEMTLGDKSPAISTLDPSVTHAL